MIKTLVALVLAAMPLLLSALEIAPPLTLLPLHQLLQLLDLTATAAASETK
jgi:hypothetical protein